jgi:hypothetical protein
MNAVAPATTVNPRMFLIDFLLSEVDVLPGTTGRGPEWFTSIYRRLWWVRGC